MIGQPEFGGIYSCLMLDATRLRVLVAVAKYGSVTAAAQALNYAQPSISHHIARLEAETGAKLMERAGRGVKLTDAGQLLAERAEEILGRIDAAEAELALHIGLRQDRVRLAAFGSALGTLVAVAGATLHADHADSGIQITQADPAHALRMLRAGETDVALIFKYLRDGAEPDSMLTETKVSLTADESNIWVVLDEPVYLISPATSASSTPTSDRAGGSTEASTGASTDPERRRALLVAHADQRWIGADEQCTEFTVDLCRCAGFVPAITTRSADYVASQALVAAGLGVAIVPGLALRAVGRPGLEATELPGARRQVLAVTYSASPDTSAVTRLVDALVSAQATAQRTGCTS